MRQCIFCKSDLSVVARAKEHILPKWLLTEWNLGDDIIEPTHFDKNLEVVSSRKQTLGTLLAGQVCAPCNNGWMSALERDCKDLILHLAAGERKATDISDKDALLLSRWTVKTAQCLHAASNYRSIIDESHYAKLDKEDYLLPNNVFVVGHTYKASSTFSWTQTTTSQITARNYQLSKEDIQLVKDRGYKIGLRVGGLFLMVFYNPLEIARPCLWWLRHIPLYPRWSHPVAWQKQDREWPQKHEARFQRFVFTLGLSIDNSSQPSPKQSAADPNARWDTVRGPTTIF